MVFLRSCCCWCWWYLLSGIIMLLLLVFSSCFVCDTVCRWCCVHLKLYKIWQTLRLWDGQTFCQKTNISNKLIISETFISIWMFWIPDIFIQFVKKYMSTIVLVALFLAAAAAVEEDKLNFLLSLKWHLDIKSVVPIHKIFGAVIYNY